MSARLFATVLVLLMGGCRGEVRPGDVTASDACTFCRMSVSDPRVAAQISAPGDEPRFFDDIGCLAAWLNEQRAPEGAIAWVADHPTGRWVRAAEAVYTRARARSTPMGSSIIAHADAASRDSDPAARDGEPLATGAVFGEARVPGSTHAR